MISNIKKYKLHNVVGSIENEIRFDRVISKKYFDFNLVYQEYFIRKYQENYFTRYSLITSGCVLYIIILLAKFDGIL